MKRVVEQRMSPITVEELRDERVLLNYLADALLPHCRVAQCSELAGGHDTWRPSVDRRSVRRVVLRDRGPQERLQGFLGRRGRLRAIEEEPTVRRCEV
eukprot:6900305-Prymnesium_polylepis.2